jgi:hypothetical protein
MLKKLILALAVMGLIGAAAGTVSARGHGYRGGGYCHRPHYHHHHAYRPYYGGAYYRGPSSYFGPGYGYRGFGGYYGGYGGYGYGGSGIAIRIGF